ncbi:hypothetical protein DM02DRAFT_595106 [Periconia macrospinosa]|uniref:Zn(2)-C6 fungal-type domain-containing protein n=1 Tax=Periconia macrospinosa TaxID=97972 RepID=A0A2V1DM33_9PLEO|nr:hypothetical protein DM02DRAFT_595106 [Periconia macrospinosa]
MPPPQPLSKRKSCASCVKAKRKCGMELPRCARCMKKDVTCYYPNPRGISTQRAFSMGGGAVAAVSLNEDETGFAQQQQQQQQQLQTNITPSTTAVKAKEPSYLQTTQEKPNPRALSRSQTDAALHRFRTWPDKWVKEGKAPFIHPRLYSPEMPKPLQDAYAACAIYSVKTAQNEAIAFTVIESKANEVLRSRADDAEDNGAASWTPLDLLAAVQALIIFQFIRLFDGDIRQRAQAEEAQLVLQAWSDELEARTELERVFTTDTAPSWRSWIFAESVRRTMVMSLNLAGVYSYLFHGFCTFGPRLQSYTFTAQRWLWEAKSELEWDRVKQSRASYYITKLDFNQVLHVGQEEELDEFGVMMLIMVKGQDYFDDWIMSKQFTRPPIMDLNIGKTLADLVQPSGDVGSISVI